MTTRDERYDVIVIGAGVSGLYALHHFREMGLSVRVYDAASDVGGTWWYNRYPGARVDGPGSPFYCYTFSAELMQAWDWQETQSEWSEVLGYVRFVADKLDLRRDIQFETWVRSARYHEAAQRWSIETDRGERASARFLICAVGALSTANVPNIPGIHDFAGERYHTGRWPHEPVSFAGKRVAVLGTGSSGIQSIPEIAKTAAHVTVLQRTPQYSAPAGNRPLTPEERATARADFAKFRAKMIANPGGFPFDPNPRVSLDHDREQRRAVYEELWQRGSFRFFTDGYGDVATSEQANAILSDFIRDKIREIVHDPEIARKLLPDFYVMTKRPILDDGYFECFNRSNVTLVDLREDPIERFTKNSVVTRSGEHPIDMLVLATGFDAISGTMLKLDPIGRGGVHLKERWHDRFHNYGRRFPEPVHDSRSGLARRSLQHAARRRAPDRLDRGAAAPPREDRRRCRGADARERDCLVRRSRRHREHDALPAHELVVDGREHRGQAPLLLRLPRRLDLLCAHRRRGGEGLRGLHVRAGAHVSLARCAPRTRPVSAPTTRDCVSRRN